MPSLMSLPRELRDEIIDYVILSPKPAPVFSAVSESFYPNDHGRRAQKHSSGDGRWIYSPRASCAYHASGTELLNTCRQLRAEVHARMMAGNKTTYVLDIMVMGRYCLWPTWLQIPQRCSDERGLIESLDIHIRFLERTAGSGSAEQCYTAKNLSIGLHGIIRDFLRQEVCSIRRRAEYDYMFGVRTIRFHVHVGNGRKMSRYRRFRAFEEVFIAKQFGSQDYWPSHRIDRIELLWHSSMTVSEFLKPGGRLWKTDGHLSLDEMNSDRKRLGLEMLEYR